MLTSVARVALDIALPGGAGARLSVLGYYRVLPAPDSAAPSDPTVAATTAASEAGFTGAVSSSPGAARPGSDPFQIPRFTPWDRGRLRFAARMWNNAIRVEPHLLSIGIATMPGTQ
jgi:hypothetical protein